MQILALLIGFLRNFLTVVFFLPFVFALLAELELIVYGPRIPALAVAAVVIAILGVGQRFGEDRRAGLSGRPELVLALIVFWFAVDSMLYASPAFAFPIVVDGVTHGRCLTQAATFAGVLSLLSLLSILCFVLDAILGLFLPAGMGSSDNQTSEADRAFS